MSRWGIIKRLAVVTAVLLAALNYVVYVRLGFAGPIPDLIPLGASVEQVFSFRDALGFEGQLVFNQTYRPLDAVFLTCLALLLCLIATMFRPLRFWWMVGLFAVIFAAADVVENAVLAQIVNTVPHKWDVELAGYVNVATRIKFAALLLAAAAIVFLWKQRREAS